MSMSKIILLLLLLAPLRMAAASPDCAPGREPGMEASFACSQMWLLKAEQDLCVRIMAWGGVDMSVSHKEEETGYVSLAAWFAVESFEVTRIAARNQLNHNTSLSGEERRAYEGCMKDYALAGRSITRVADEMLPSCRITGLSGEYNRALNSIVSCMNRLSALARVNTPLYPMVLADQDKAVLAYHLATLIGVV
ncbi:uncharacterized protein LOC119271193 [Triticum dicoccoides]|uniref:uncharacterized protein LOC119271193 n=1 Tax=Triticum dicoccoides TaxID=85692 RepID=UPI00188EB4B8|nr:uncharacterized protein LOC119271193 [Triticum dicoccoides]